MVTDTVIADRAGASDAAADIAACRDMLRGGSRSFFAASLLLPGRVARPATALYAFCRQADDAIDLHGGRSATLAQLSKRLDRAYAGRPLPHPVDRAFSAVVLGHAIPRALPEALLEGLAWDAAGHRYPDISSLRAYGARVAGAVGAMTTLVMGGRSPEVVARACDLGVAMQLTNIARDVGEDARSGRLYLPADWMREEGVSPEEFLARPVASPALARVIARLLAEAEALYARADAGIARLPGDCRPGVRAARLLYAAIGHQVAINGHDSVSRRAVVPKGRKLALLARAFLVPVDRPEFLDAPALAETRHLVEAIPRRPEELPPIRWWQVGSGMGRILEILERVERREAGLGMAERGGD